MSGETTVHDAVSGAEPMDDETMDAVQPGSSDGLSAELEQTRMERDQLRERLLRLQAEFDNARKREGREKQDARDYAVQSTVEPFLSVMDNFNLALKADGSA